MHQIGPFDYENRHSQLSTQSNGSRRRFQPVAHAQHGGLFPDGFDRQFRTSLILGEANSFRPSVESTLSAVAELLPQTSLITEHALKHFPRALQVAGGRSRDGLFIDALRYAYVLPQDQFVSSFQEVLRAITSRGYQEFRRENYWRPGSRLPLGIGSHLQNLKNGYCFQLRFFTPDQHERIERAHKYYEMSRVSDNDEVIAACQAAERRCFDGLQPPKGVLSITSFDHTPPAVTPRTAKPHPAADELRLNVAFSDIQCPTLQLLLNEFHPPSQTTMRSLD